ncbi:hypothetical protein [Absidia glauca]|uniref:CRAL/TRIO N-terminal domain-containing protein n=1 Tax=Absidia glauca TaxID=4829 RepID=A0A168MT46_ABSGL|nr:hypothetical protein [Absidia glauca]
MVSARTERDKAVAIARLRSQLKGYPPVTDEYIERFLVARNWNVDSAFKQMVATFVWRKENETDLYPVATKENNLSVLLPVRGFASIPDQNVKAGPGTSETVIRLNEYLGGSCLHKTDKEGCPIYIERAVRVP